MNRVPPHDQDVERALIGAMLLSRNAVDVASEIVDADAFYIPAHSYIFDTVMSLAAAGQPVDAITVADELKRLNLLETIGGPGVLLELQGATPATSSAGRYARIVADYHTQRDLIAVGTEIAEKGYELTDDIQATLDEAESLMFRLGNHRSAETMAAVPEIMDEAIDLIEARSEMAGTITGTATGYQDYDYLTGGLQPSSLVTIGARPGMGKTSFAMGMAAQAAISDQKPVLFVSLEMSKLELTQRLLCMEAKVDSTRVRTGKLTADDWQRIANAAPRFAEAKLWIDDNPQATVMDIRAKARRLTQQQGPLGMIIIDYLQLMTGRGKAENRQNEVSEMSRGLKVLAREMECPVVALSQLNRGLESRLDKRPVLSDLRDSGSIEQDSDIVVFLYRDEQYNPDTPDAGTAEVLVAKHRAGPTGMVRLAFLAQYTKFASMARP